MRMRTRKLIGAAAMIGFVVVYSLVAMALAQARPLQGGGAAGADHRLCDPWPRLDRAVDAADPLDATP